MKNAGFILLSILVFASCDETETAQTETENVSYEVAAIPNDTIRNQISITDSTQILLLGRGSEPGWICEFYGNKVRFVYNYGKDSIIIKGLNFTYQMKSPTGFELFKLESPSKDTIFETLKGPCTEESTGESKTMKMQITVGKNTFNGCAWVPK